MSSQWTPPSADKQAWAPPAADRQGSVSRDHGDRLKGTPANFPDNFMGTLAKDFAALPEGVWNAATHPIDTVKGAVQQLVNLPGDVVTDISQGNWGKLGAKFAELAVPAMSTERGAAMAGAAGTAAKDAVGAVGSKVAEVAANPVARELIGVASPRLKNALAAFHRVKTAAEKAAAEDATVAAPAAAESVTPGQMLARESGTDWANLSPQDQANFDLIARARANVAAQPAPTAGAQPTVGTRPTVGAEPTVASDPRTAADMIRDEVAAQQQPTPAPSSPPIGVHKANPPINGGGSNLRPPLRSAAPPDPAQVAPAVDAVPAASPVRTLPQVEAGMAQTNPPVIENTQTRTNADGSTMSPQMRGETAKAGNVAAKADRWAPILHKFGITAADLPRISPAQWEQVTAAMKQQGLLDAEESAPKSSIPEIAKRLKALEKGTQQGQAAAISPQAGTPPESSVSALPDLAAVPLAKLQKMSFADLKALFPPGTPKADITTAIAKAMQKSIEEGSK